MDPQLFKETGATSAVNRLYTNPGGNTVALHATVTVFTNDWHLPHPPPRCYTGSGHSIIKTKTLEIARPDGTTIPVDLMTTELAGKRSYVLYWYQVGDQIVLDGPQLRQLAWTMRGKQAWPPVLKLMLTTAALDKHQAIRQLVNIAEPLAEWTAGFNDTLRESKIDADLTTKPNAEIPGHVLEDRKR